MLSENYVKCHNNVGSPATATLFHREAKWTKLKFYFFLYARSLSFSHTELHDLKLKTRLFQTKFFNILLKCLKNSRLRIFILSLSFSPSARALYIYSPTHTIAALGSSKLRFLFIFIFKLYFIALRPVGYIIVVHAHVCVNERIMLQKYMRKTQKLLFYGFFSLLFLSDLVQKFFYVFSLCMPIKLLNKRKIF